MLRYRALLIDTEAVFERPVQALFGNKTALIDWAHTALAHASDTAEVVLYEIEERELQHVKKSELRGDQGPVEAV